MRLLDGWARSAWLLAAMWLGGVTQVGAQLPSPLFVPDSDAPSGRRARLLLDFDLDGDVDVLDDVGVLWNDGAGGFAAGPPMPPLPPTQGGATWQHTVAGDFDADGLRDVCLVTGTTSYVSGVVFLKNLGGGVLIVQPSFGLAGFSSNQGVRRVFAADFDQDGRDDLVFAPYGSGNYAGVLPSLLLCSSAFSFSPAAGSWNAAFAQFNNVVAVEDFDADGDPDVLATLSTVTPPPGLVAGTHLALTMNSGGSFLPGPMVFFSTGSDFFEAVTYADFDGDGVKDLVSETFHYPAVFLSAWRVAFQAGVLGGTFSPPVFTSVAAPYRAGAAVDAVADPGAEYARRADVEWTVYDIIGGAASTLQTIPAFDASAFGAGPREFGFGGDLDADGDRDLLVVSRNGLLETFHADGFGALVGSKRALPTEAIGGKGTLVFDADGDGAADVVAAWPAAPGSIVDVVRTARNDGFGTFVAGPAPTPIPAVGVSPTPLRLAEDLDGDGDRDVFGYTGTANTPTMFRNDGPLGWTPISTSGTAAVARDFNGDGLVDMAYGGIAAGFFSIGVVVRMNLGGGAFGPEIPLGQGANAQDLEAEDLDADGDFDLISVGSLAAIFGPGAGMTPNAIFLNNGSGVFSVAAVGPAVPWTSWVTTGDLDGDGINDLVVGGQVIFGGVGWSVYGPSMAPFPNINASGSSFARSPEHLVDLDGDGSLDLLGSAYWRRGLGAGFFAPPDVFAPHRIVNGLLVSEGFTFGVAQVGDLDRDGDLDLVDDDRVVYLNRRRHLRPGLPARLGRVATLDVAGPSFAPFGLWVAAGRSSAPLDLGPIGLGFLDPSSAIYFGSFGLNASGEATIALTVPSLPALVGLQLAWEAGFPADARLSGLAETPIVGF